MHTLHNVADRAYRRSDIATKEIKFRDNSKTKKLFLKTAELKLISDMSKRHTGTLPRQVRTALVDNFLLNKRYRVPSATF